MRKLIYYVAVSADGFIAAADGSFAAFPQEPATLAALAERYPETFPAPARAALGIDGPPRRFDTVIMGRRTHQPALDAGLTSAYPHLRQYVVSHRELPADPTVTVTADPVGTVRELKQQDGLDLWLCGGAELAGQLVDEIDAYHLKINPLLLGDGIPLLAGAPGPRPLTLRSAETLPGEVQLAIYERG